MPYPSSPYIENFSGGAALNMSSKEMLNVALGLTVVLLLIVIIVSISYSGWMLFAIIPLVGLLGGLGYLSSKCMDDKFLDPYTMGIRARLAAPSSAAPAEVELAQQ